MHQMVEEDRVVLDDQYEFEIPCEIPRVAPEMGCDYRPAEWIAYRSIICSCGIIIRLVCNPCKERYQMAMARGDFFTCPGCEEETKGFDRFEPLERHS